MINRQQHRYTCGVVALMNMFEWLVKPMVSYSVFREWCKLVRVLDPCYKGMTNKDITYILDTCNIKYLEKKSIDINKINQALTQGKSVLLLYVTNRGGGHAVFIDQKKNSRYRIWNDSDKNKTPYRSEKTLIKHLEQSKHLKDWPYALIFDRREN